MIRPLPLAAALLTPACSPEPASQATPRPTPAATADRATPPVTADSHATPKPGTIRTFGDWTVGCDNGGRCAMLSLIPEDSATGTETTIALIRDPGAQDHYTLSRTASRAAGATVDGRAIPGDADALARAMANGTTLAVAGTAGRISLKGASAALRYIDAAQGRAGTTSATVARGAATVVPPAPALPVVRAIALRPHAGTLDPRQLATMRRLGQCEDMSGLDAPTLAEAEPGTLIAALPCSAGAYNVIAALFVIRGGTVTPAATDAPAGFEATGADSQTPVHSLINPDLADGVLTSFAKGRGLGDCGLDQSFAWDGTRLRLVEQSEMPECRGNTATITTWRARVVR
ncbi:MAG: DUF1176 domain-containing protein [Sphingomonas taxi]